MIKMEKKLKLELLLDVLTCCFMHFI